MIKLIVHNIFKYLFDWYHKINNYITDNNSDVDELETDQQSSPG